MSVTNSESQSVKRKGGFIELISIFLQALILAVIIRTFLFQPFVIPSGSMRPTLLVGDYLFVSKFSYGYSHYSLPFSPDLFSGRIFGRQPKRGDILVFRHHDVYTNRDEDFIKRLIGLPGDRIQMRQGVLYINDVAVPREKVGELDNVDVTEVNRPVDVYRERLPNGVTYDTLDIIPFAEGDNTRVFEVPPDHYFMMGDNRDNSEDSRFSVGYVPFENLIGRANLIFFSIGNGAKAYEIWRWPFDVRWSRVLSWVTTIHYFPPEKQ